MSEVYSINTADTRLTDEILDFVKTGKYLSNETTPREPPSPAELRVDIRASSDKWR